MKNLQNTLFLNTPKWLCIFWIKPFDACKKKEKEYKIKEGWYQDIWHLKKQGRILKI
jgi:hypothetical protein